MLMRLYVQRSQRSISLNKFCFGEPGSKAGVKTVAARGPVNGRGPRRRRGRDLVFTPALLPGVCGKINDNEYNGI